MKQAYCLVIGVLCAGYPTLAYAQTGVLAKDTARNGVITFLRLDPKMAPRKVSESTAVLRNLLQLTSRDELRNTQQRRDDVGFTHQWHRQFYQGVPVEYGTYVVHARNEIIETIDGGLIKTNGINPVPTLTEQQALARALKAVDATLYKWQVPSEEQWIKKLKRDEQATFLPKGELLITQPRAEVPQVHLAYKFVIYAQQPASSEYVYIDAHTGAVIQRQPVSQHGNSPGTAETRYSQTRNIVTDSFNATYRLRESGRGAGTTCGGGGSAIETLNAAQSSSLGSAVDFIDNDNSWVEFNNPQRDNAALDAHWGSESTYDYFNLRHCRNSYDGAGGTIRGYVHADLPTLGYATNNDNAGWDPNLRIMIYGDGAVTFHPLTSLDVVAHEIGHGYAQSMVNFNPGSSEALAINEGLSDIWAACVEQYAAPNKQIWKVGEDIMRTASCLRNMESPNVGIDPSTTRTGGYPDVYNGPYYDSGSNPSVHTNSTVLSHFFYLLTTGKTGTNSVGTAFSVNGIGIEKAANIVFRAESFGYITSNSGFAQTRNAMVNAAIDLYGVCSVEATATQNAWHAVGIGQPAPSGPPTYDGIITETPALCSLNQVEHTVYNPSPGASYQWSITGSGAYIKFGRLNQTVTLGLRRGGTYNLSVNVSNSCGSVPYQTGDVETEPYYWQCDYYFTASPNPGNEQVTLAVSPKDRSKQKGADSEFDIRVYNNSGTMVSTGHTTQSKYVLNTASMREGIYVVHAVKGNQILRQNISVQH
ncbi:M4 family metallopeptidase [Hymenobacter puniceus]|uniref:M4 family metallopeptidase n=1 Tax=Hymenobacter sp. BT190 TaxID=2763505 RepID=UPI0016512C04|nr:M4 family metallopeptidase [Hymenobacter sp. BT190]MBC6700476.1 M4 family metallopeptidase [Hymenobacter sp. BT190]